MSDQPRYPQKSVESEKVISDALFENLVWMNSAEAASYLRISYGALRVAVCRKQIFARKFRNRLYFRRAELDRLLEGSLLKGAY